MAVLAAAVEASEIIVPESLVMNAATSTMQQFLQQLQSEGGNLELYAQMVGKSLEEVKRDFWSDAVRSVKITYLLNKIVADMGFEISEDEHQEGIMSFARQYNIDTEDFEEVKERVGPMVDRIAQELKSQKAAQYLIDHAIIKLVDRKDMDKAPEASILN
jgi:trigger factor